MQLQPLNNSNRRTEMVVKNDHVYFQHLLDISYSRWAHIPFYLATEPSIVLKTRDCVYGDHERARDRQAMHVFFFMLRKLFFVHQQKCL